MAARVTTIACLRGSDSEVVEKRHERLLSPPPPSLSLFHFLFFLLISLSLAPMYFEIQKSSSCHIRSIVMRTVKSNKIRAIN